MNGTNRDDSGCQSPETSGIAPNCPSNAAFDGPQHFSVCASCGKQITDPFILRVNPNLEFHAGCLKCYSCDRELDETCTTFVRNGQTFCRDDYLRLFGRQCSRCRNAFEKHDMVMRARNLVFHIPCFSCFSCRAPLRPGEQFLIKGEELYCQRAIALFRRFQGVQAVADTIRQVPRWVVDEQHPELAVCPLDATPIHKSGAAKHEVEHVEFEQQQFHVEEEQKGQAVDSGPDSFDGPAAEDSEANVLDQHPPGRRHEGEPGGNDWSQSEGDPGLVPKQTVQRQEAANGDERSAKNRRKGTGPSRSPDQRHRTAHRGIRHHRHQLGNKPHCHPPVPPKLQFVGAQRRIFAGHGSATALHDDESWKQLR
uniref:LIM zinc-binding domain-containing protein n=1 Tax=Panagrolaimus sp. JU765 TaxID=591449 RepID=A0AC34QYH4_9BILA